MKYRSKIFILVVATLTSTILFIRNRNIKKTQFTLDPKTYGYINPKSLSNAKGETPNFSLLDHSGKYFELYRSKKHQYLLFIAINPMNINAIKLSELENRINKLSKLKIKLFFILPSEKIDRDQINTLAKNANLNSSILLDPSMEITRLLSLKNYFDYVLIETNQWKKLRLNEFNFSDNINKLLSDSRFNQKIRIPFEINNNQNFTEVIAPILKNKCLNCHSEKGHFLPYFDSYNKFKNWSEMSKETILNGRMPPIGADSYYGDYQDNFELTPKEKRALLQWLDQKKPQSISGIDPLKNIIPENQINSNYPFIYETAMDQSAPIAPGGQMEYGYVQLGGPVPKDLWVAGVFVQSTNPRQLHHEAIMITSKPLSVYRELGIKKFHISEKKLNKNQDGDIVLYTLRAMRSYEMKHSPGTYFRSQVWGAGKPQPFYFGNNNLAFIPRGYYIIMENHYMGTGKEDSEKTTIKFYGHNELPKTHQRLYSFTLTTNDFEIPPNEDNYKVETPTWEITQDLKFTNFLPHLHMRGKSVSLEAIDKKGNVKIIYSAPNFNYGWQTGFIVSLKQPIEVKKGTKLRAICYFDNSELNPFNPDPNKNIKFGQRLDRTEMCKINTNFVLKNVNANSHLVFKPINKKINPQDFYEE